MKYAIIAALLLAGCATVPPDSAPIRPPAPKHHHRLALKAPPMAVSAPVAVAPAQAVPMPVKRPTARERGLHALRWLFRSKAQ